MTNKKYLVCPGFMLSKTDGQNHWISANQLIELYSVNPQECVVDIPVKTRGWNTAHLTKLYPRYDGNYLLSEATK